MPAEAASGHIPSPEKRKPEGFPKGTPVVTDRGIVFIEDVRQGDKVVDHNGKWAKVTKSHKRKGPTARISGDGHPPIEASDGHPVLVRQKDGSPAWVAPKLLNPKIHEWATPTHFDPLPISTGAPSTPEEWRRVGRHLRGERKGTDGLDAGFVSEHFGSRPHTRTIPGWVLGMDVEHRRALLDGYVGPKWDPPPTTSPLLITGMRLVSESEGVDNRTDINPVLSPLRPRYKMSRLKDGHGGGGNHSWLRNQRGEDAGRVRELHELEVGEGGGGAYCAGTGGKMVSACGEKPEPKPNARNRAAATPPARTSRNGGGGGGSNGRSAQSPDRKPHRMPRTIPSVASVVDALGSSVPVVGRRKPRSPQRDTVPLTPAQEQRVQQGVRSLDGVRREETVANAAAVPQSARAQEAARRAEDRLNQRGVSVAELAELRQVDALNKDIPGTAASSIAQQRGLVQQDVRDVLAAERPAGEQRVIRDFDDAQTISQLGKVTADWLKGIDRPADQRAPTTGELAGIVAASGGIFGLARNLLRDRHDRPATYNAEWAASDGMANLSVEEARALVHRFAPNVEMLHHPQTGDLGGYTHADGKTIDFYGKINPLGVSHELAHLRPGGMGHGKDFRRSHLDTAEELYGPEVRARLATAYAEHGAVVSTEPARNANHLRHPGGYDEPADETAQIRDPLIQLNQAGYATHGSQPGHAPTVGWDGRTYEQRAAVDGFADRATADRIQAAAEAEGLTVIRHSGAGRRTDYSKDVDTTFADGQPVTGFGQRLGRSDVDLAMGGYMTDELRRAEQVTIVDEEIGRNDRLERFAQRMDDQRRSDPINDAWMVDDLNGLKPGTTENDMRRARGEAVPDLRDDLRTPAEREEREARMAAAEQVHAQNREQAQPRDTTDRAQPLPLERPGLAAESGGPMFDRFATEGASAETAPRHVGAQVDGRTVPAEIIDAPAAHGQPERVPTAVDSYGFAPGLSEPPNRQRLEQGEAPLRVEDIAAAAREREAQSVDWDHIGAAMAGRAPMPKDQRELVGAHGGPALAEATAAVAAPIPSGASSARPAVDRGMPEHRHDADPAKAPAPTPRPAVAATPPSPGAWNEIYAREAQIAATARDRGLPIDHETFERRLDEAWNRLQTEQNGADTTPPERRLGRSQAGEHDIESTLAAMDRPREQSAVPPEAQRGLHQAGWREPPTLPTLVPDADANKVAPERERGLPQAGEAGLPPPPTVNQTSTERPAHDHDVLERHGLADLIKPDAADDTPSEADRKPPPEGHEPPAKPVDDATAERTTDRITEEASHPAVPDDTREQGHETAKEPEPTSDAKRVDEPAPEPAEARTPERPEQDAKPDAKPAEEPATEPEPEAKPEPEKAAEPEKPDPEPEPDKTPEPEAKESTSEPDREPRQWEQDAKEAMEPAHSDPAPAHEAPSHHMGPEL